MNTLLVIAVIVTALGILVQAGMLIAMYSISRRLSDNVNRLTAPLESITSDLKAASDNLTEVGKIAREETRRAEQVLSEMQETIRIEIADFKERILDPVEAARHTVMRPLREWSAIAQGVAEGVRTFFRKRPPTTRQEHQDQPPEIAAAS
ncbi:MAG: hypothetical protein DMG13_05295 [Acidobacteria bacterium]|nr:MAG: hypothetical protein DMG13_05295 [Acidobacteriota bacterium]